MPSVLTIETQACMSGWRGQAPSSGPGSDSGIALHNRQATTKIKTNHFNWLNKPKGPVYVAFSGGIDSASLALALMQTNEVTLAFFDHGNLLAKEEESFVDAFAEKYKLKVIKGRCIVSKPAHLSKEEFWRNSRYEWFKTLTDAPIATGHTLDDAVEWYLFTAFTGEGHYMSYRHGNVIRPFLLTRKEVLIDFARQNEMPWFEDPSNANADFANRNRIRNEILPSVLKVNPGIYKVVSKKISAKTTAEKDLNVH